MNLRKILDITNNFVYKNREELEDTDRSSRRIPQKLEDKSGSQKRLRGKIAPEPIFCIFSSVYYLRVARGDAPRNVNTARVTNVSSCKVIMLLKTFIHLNCRILYQFVENQMRGRLNIP